MGETISNQGCSLSNVKFLAIFTCFKSIARHKLVLLNEYCMKWRKCLQFIEGINSEICYIVTFLRCHTYIQGKEHSANESLYGGNSRRTLKWLTILEDGTCLRDLSIREGDKRLWKETPSNLNLSNNLVLFVEAFPLCVCGV